MNSDRGDASDTERTCRAVRKVEHATAHERPPIIDPNHH
jgi:hypothetical protein